MQQSKRFITLAGLSLPQPVPLLSFVQPTPPPCVPKSPSLIPLYEIVKSLPNKPSDLINQIRELPQFEPSTIYGDADEVELATTLHGFATSAYYWHSDAPSLRIPSNIAIPFWELSKHLDRAPILSMYATYFENWKLKKPSLGFHPDNVDSIFTFSGTSDETYFYHVGTCVENLGSQIIEQFPIFYNAIETKNEAEVKASLKEFERIIHEMNRILVMVFDRVNPEVFYYGFRKYLASFEGAIFEGVSETPQKLMGATAAQSPSVRLIDAIFDLNGNDEFLAKVPYYMKREHRDLIDFAKINRPRDLRDAVIGFEAADEWNPVIEEICNFRKIHFRLAYTYIIKFTKDSHSKGTGGTAIDSFLNNLLANTRKNLIPK